MDMIIASHDGINGDYNKFLDMFKINSKPISKEEQMKYIEIYIKDKNIAEIIKSYLND